MKQKINQNLGFLTAKFIIIDIIGDFLYWPIWWYSVGLKNLILYIFKEILTIEGQIGIKMWLSTMLKPMYGQYDWQGRLISFFMRFFVLLYMLIKFMLWICILIIMVILWVLLLPFCLYQIFSFLY